jgi:hypothetical protein
MNGTQPDCLQQKLELVQHLAMNSTCYKTHTYCVSKQGVEENVSMYKGGLRKFLIWSFIILCSLNNNMMIKSRIMSWPVYVANKGMRNAYIIFIRKHEGKRPL